MYVEFEYYREDSGKYYSSGQTEIPIEFDQHWRAAKYVKEMLIAGKRPGLVDGHEFDVLVKYYTSLGCITGLYTRTTLSKAKQPTKN